MAPETNPSQEDLLKQVQGLEERLARLEGQLTRRFGSWVTQPIRTSPRPVVSPETAGSKTARQSQTLSPGEDVETRVGKYWLNRIGIAALIVGVAFFVSYTFRPLGVYSKLAVGYLLAISLEALGIFLEKKKDLRWYGTGLIGGGWALLYFTTYAAHHIDTVRVIPSELVDLFLLMGVGAGVIAHSLKYKSQIVTGVAFLLTFVTSAVSHVDTFTLLSCTLVSGVLAYLVWRFQWTRLAFVGVFATYAIHAFWIKPQISSSPAWTLTSDIAHVHFWRSSGFLTMYWLLYSLLAHFLRPKSRREEDLIAGLTVFNAFAYSLLTSYEIFKIAPENRFWFCLVLGLIYGIMGMIQKRMGHERLTTTHAILGLSFVTIALPVRFQHEWTSLAWLVEILTLTVLGCRLDKSSYRFFAYALGITMFFRFLIRDLYLTDLIHLWGIGLQPNMLIAYFAVVSFWGSSLVIRHSSYRPKLLEIEELAPGLLTALGAFVLMLIFVKEIRRDWQSLSLVFGGALTLGIGIFFSDKVFRVLGLLLLALAILFFIVYNLPGINTIYRIVSCIVLGVVLLIASFAYAHYESRTKKG